MAYREKKAPTLDICQEYEARFLANSESRDYIKILREQRANNKKFVKQRRLKDNLEK